MIECKICHKKFRQLTTHLNKAHRMPKKTYSYIYHTDEFVDPVLKEEMRVAQEPHRQEKSAFMTQQWIDGTLKGKKK
ncbi:MAG: hypothetical protein WC401_10345 [Bacteroidales bacterium]|jgi:hypothetical protein